jgi:hypothetical protein
MTDRRTTAAAIRSSASPRTGMKSGTRSTGRARSGAGRGSAEPPLGRWDLSTGHGAAAVRDGAADVWQVVGSVLTPGCLGVPGGRLTCIFGAPGSLVGNTHRRPLRHRCARSHARCLTTRPHT